MRSSAPTMDALKQRMHLELHRRGARQRRCVVSLHLLLSGLRAPGLLLVFPSFWVCRCSAALAPQIRPHLRIAMKVRLGPSHSLASWTFSLFGEVSYLTGCHANFKNQPLLKMSLSRPCDDNANLLKCLHVSLGLKWWIIELWCGGKEQGYSNDQVPAEVGASSVQTALFFWWTGRPSVHRRSWPFLWALFWIMAQNNSSGQGTNGVADESPNMIVYRKVRLLFLVCTCVCACVCETLQITLLHHEQHGDGRALLRLDEHPQTAFAHVQTHTLSSPHRLVAQPGLLPVWGWIWNFLPLEEPGALTLTLY